LKRFQRKGLGYSKSLEVHKLAVAFHFSWAARWASNFVKPAKRSQITWMPISEIYRAAESRWTNNGSMSARMEAG
jgi:hypothetical protein